jgi:hypothetical protein
VLGPYDAEYMSELSRLPQEAKVCAVFVSYSPCMWAYRHAVAPTTHDMQKQQVVLKGKTLEDFAGQDEELAKVFLKRERPSLSLCMCVHMSTKHTHTPHTHNIHT